MSFKLWGWAKQVIGGVPNLVAWYLRLTVHIFTCHAWQSLPTSRLSWAHLDIADHARLDRKVCPSLLRHLCQNQAHIRDAELRYVTLEPDH